VQPLLKIKEKDASPKIFFVVVFDEEKLSML